MLRVTNLWTFILKLNLEMTQYDILFGWSHSLIFFFFLKINIYNFINEATEYLRSDFSPDI